MIESAEDPKSIKKAVELLKQGRVVAIPTETVYGLAAVYSNESAINEIFTAKGRPKNDPLIVHIAHLDQLNLLTDAISIDAQDLMNSFWPGPLTLVLPKKKNVLDAITSGLKTVAVRMPRHPIALQLIELVGEPLAAPSANRFQSISPTTAQAVEQELGDRIPLVLDGGNCERGIESTVVSVEGGVEVLRLGAIPVEDLELVLGKPVVVRKSSLVDESKEQVSPGLLSFHYAPRNSLKLMDQVQVVDHQSVWVVFSDSEKEQLARLGVKTIFVLSSRGDLQEAAQKFFSTLRAADQLQRPICALKLPDKGLGRSINDRLSRAQHK